MKWSIRVRESAADDQVSVDCQVFLDKNEKAALQWDLEKRYAAFDESFEVASREGLPEISGLAYQLR